MFSSSDRKTFILRLFFFFFLSFFIYKQSYLSLKPYVPKFLRPRVRRTHYPKESFVTFITHHKIYRDLLDVLLDSVHLFSTRPIIIFPIDFDLIINSTRHPRVFIERISQDDCGETQFACKLLAMISSEVKYGVQLEVDSIVNYNIDLLFDMLHHWPYDLPLAPKHPDDARNYQTFLERYEIKQRTVPYMHATFAWTFRAYPFLRQVLALMQKREFLDANFDETAMNIMLWKAKTTHILCRYDPFGPISIKDYENLSDKPKCAPYCDGVYLIFHGQKNSWISENILQRILKLGPHHPFVQTPRGLKWLNDTNVTCCHSSARRTSPLHPLLCEYDMH
ncbi:unnamed protein product [Adineta ricciae]|uniref:Uncharacterized protein n=1 Tax=Adineta ricciae TaxID=249248 RepID=A0A814NRB4_ADIRI|nr:unnamed protein product [Adineta ricciae]